MPHFEVLFLSIELILNILPKVIEVKLKGGDESVNPCRPTEAKKRSEAWFLAIITW